MCRLGSFTLNYPRLFSIRLAIMRHALAYGGSCLTYAGVLSAAWHIYLEVVSIPQITPKNKAWADEINQRARAYVFSVRGRAP